MYVRQAQALMAIRWSQFGAAVRAGTDHRLRPSPALIAGLVVVGAVGWGTRWMVVDVHASGDTFWYSRQALEIAGYSESQATVRAAEYMVSIGAYSDTGALVAFAQQIDPRYPAIFEARPLYPAIAALFVPAIGLDAMVVAAFLGGLLFAVGFGLMVNSVTGSGRSAAVAVLLAYALPTGHWLAFLYADGWMLAVWTLAVGCAVAYLRGGGRSWILAFGVALAALYATKTANGACLVVAVIVVAAIECMRRAPGRGRLGVLAGVAAVLGIGQLALFAALGAASLNDSLQDYFTTHFVLPDVDNPWRLLVRRLIRLAPGFVMSALAEPFPLALVAGSSTSLLASASSWAVLWVVAGLSSGLTIVAHPVLSQIPRLLAPMWVTVALGLTIGGGAVLSMSRSRPGRIAEPRNN